ncbi:MAG: PmoA family protein, partial [Planctomycetes bacterium]|nr:PmoA family protein [Planctomycetota bacterium]
MPGKIPRCQVIPLAEHQVSLQIDGTERLRWHYGRQYPRPFFFPFAGPSGSWLTRMGHPGAPNHDHHRPIWFAHARVLGIDFWSEQTEA